ncbi:hypothetical protein N665_0970s0002 [Sinapis alba]|nr:hypothetical protein N665_0970s0002 [Sinapis alba]
MIDIKGKGILYEDDNEPTKLTDQDDAHVIKEYCMSLIGKVLNLKKQNIEKLLQTMSTQKGPFRYNCCMFVLVRWEPNVHYDYPWIISFWSIGGRLGHVDTIELSEGCMLINVDSKRPLKFERKAESPECEEVTIEIKYDMLFKHCTLCGLMTHEKGYCPTPGHQPLLRDHRAIDHRNNEIAGRQPLHQPSQNALQKDNRNIVSRYPDFSRYNQGYKGRYHDQEINTSQACNKSDNNRYGTHSGTIIIGRDNKPKVTIRRKVEPIWCEKQKSKACVMASSPVQPRNTSNGYLDVVPYEQASTSNNILIQDDQYHQTRDEERSGGERPKKRLASTIVTPSIQLPPMEDNVTIMTTSLARSLIFSPQASADALENVQIIGAFNDMELLDSNDGGMIECDVQEDDLLGEELMDIEDKAQYSVVAGSSNVNVATKSTKSARSGSRMNAPLGEAEKSRHRFHSSKKVRVSTTKDEGFMGSKIHQNIINAENQLELSRDRERPHSSTPHKDVSESSPVTCVPL